MKIKKIYAAEEVVENPVVDVAEEATDLLFEAEDVAELLAQVAEQDVEVEAEEDQVTFTVGDDVYEVTAEGDEEILESVKTKGRKAVKASARRAVRRADSKVAASKQTRRTVRRVNK